MLKLSLASLFVCAALAAPALAEPSTATEAPAPVKPQISKPAVVHSITRHGDVTEIVIHDSRRRKPKSVGVSARAGSTNFQEVTVEAPRLQAVPQALPPVAAAAPPTVWTQDYEPGPASQASANIGPSYGVNILPTRPYYGYGYGYGYNAGYGYGPGSSYGPVYYGPGAQRYSSSGYNQGYRSNSTRTSGAPARHHSNGVFNSPSHRWYR